MNLFDLIFTALATIPVLAESIPQFSERIVGGREVDIRDYPYQVSVRYNDQHKCGGSILDARTILTAAHCVEDLDHSQFGVRAGNTAHARGKFIKVSQVRQHRKYDPVVIDNDIAILKLASSLKFTSRIRPIALQPKGVNVPAGTTAWVSGWGHIYEGSQIIQEELRAVDVAVISNSKCREVYGKGVITSRMICADTRHHDACHGDTGGPLVANGKLIGVVSAGDGCARPGNPGVNAKVSAMYDWIIANK